MSRKSTTKKRRRRGILSSLFCCFGSRSHNLSQDIKSNGSPLTNHETQPSISRAEEKESKVRLWDNLSSLQFTFRFEFNNYPPGALNHICVSFQLHAHFKFPPQTTRFFHDLLHGTIKRIQCNRAKHGCIRFQGLKRDAIVKEEIINIMSICAKVVLRKLQFVMKMH